MPSEVLSARTEADDFAAQASMLGLAAAVQQAADEAIRGRQAIPLLEQQQLALECSGSFQDSIFAAAHTPSMSATGQTVELEEDIGEAMFTERSTLGAVQATAEVLGQGIQDALAGMIAAQDMQQAAHSSRDPTPPQTPKSLVEDAGDRNAEGIQQADYLLLRHPAGLLSADAFAAVVAEAMTADSPITSPERKERQRFALETYAEEDEGEKLAGDQDSVIDMDSVASISQSGVGSASARSGTASLPAERAVAAQEPQQGSMASKPSSARSGGGRSQRSVGEHSSAKQSAGCLSCDWAEGLGSGAGTEVVVEHATIAIADAVLEGVGYAAGSEASKRYAPSQGSICSVHGKREAEDLDSMSTDPREHCLDLDTPGALCSTMDTPAGRLMREDLSTPGGGQLSASRREGPPSEGSLQLSEGGGDSSATSGSGGRSCGRLPPRPAPAAGALASESGRTASKLSSEWGNRTHVAASLAGRFLQAEAPLAASKSEATGLTSEGESALGFSMSAVADGGNIAFSKLDGR